MSMQLLTCKTAIGYNKAKPITEFLRYIFDFRNFAITFRFTKTYGDFRPFSVPGKVWEVDSFVNTVVFF